MSKPLAALEADAEQWYRDNMVNSILSRGDFVDNVSALYSPPFTYLELEGEIPLRDDNETRGFIQGFSDWLDESPGWQAEVVGIQTQALNNTAMVLVAEWRIQDGAGKPITESDTVQYFYMLSKQSGAWKVVGEGTVSAKTRIKFG